MRKTREVLRLHFELHLGQRQIARSACLSQSTVHDYLERFTAAGLVWPLPSEMTEPELESALFPPATKPLEMAGARPLPDFAHLHDELQRYKHTTLQLLWEEYRAANPDGYGYSRFCYHYQQWRSQRDVVMRQQHRAGEKLFVDWAGAKIPIHSRDSDAVHEAPLFVAVLGASNYTYAEACWSQDMGCWIGAHVRTFEFMGGLPELVVPDNTRTGVSRACRYEPDLNPTYQEMAMHYGVGVLPARVRKPRDKAKVEVGVQIVQRWIVAALRHRKFFSLQELNLAIAELLAKLNQRPFRKREGSRVALLAEIDRPALRPLPKERFDLSVWSPATVNIDYHIQFERSFYSVPYQLVRQVVEVDSGSDRDLPQRHARGLACSFAQTVRGGDQPRSSSQVAPCALGLAALAHGAVGKQRRRPHRRSNRQDHGIVSASGDGLPLVPWHHSPGATLSGTTGGSRR